MGLYRIPIIKRIQGDLGRIVGSGFPLISLVLPKIISHIKELAACRYVAIWL